MNLSGPPAVDHVLARVLAVVEVVPDPAQLVPPLAGCGRTPAGASTPEQVANDRGVDQERVRGGPWWRATIVIVPVVVITAANVLVLMRPVDAGTAVLVRRAGEPGCQRPDVLDKLRGFVHLEVEPLGSHVDGQLVQRV